MKPTFNLINAPWIPCVLSGGERSELGLREVFRRAHEVEAVSHASPLVEVGVFRLLLAVLHRVIDGPRTTSAWLALWNSRRFGAEFDAYLHRWAPRFDLFDPDYPFFQVGGFALVEGDGAPVPPDTPARLVIERASGNNATLFDHAFDDSPEPMTAASAALHLLASQTWSLGGGKGPTSNRFGAHPYASHAPMVGRLHLRIQRPNLFEALIANATGLLPGGATATPQDKPVWERDQHRAPATIRPDGLLDLLTFPARAVRLQPDPEGVNVLGVVSAPGLRVDETEWHAQWDPSVATRATKDGVRPVFLGESRAAWRDVGALLAFTHAEGAHDGRPGVIRHAANASVRRAMGGHHLQRVVAVGLANDKAKPILWCRDELAFHVRLLEEEALLATVVGGVELAERVAGEALRGALGQVARQLLSNGSDRVRPLTDSLWEHGAYWADTGRAFSAFAVEIGVDEEGADRAWRARLRRGARDHFRAATAAVRRDGRGLRAVALGEAHLNRLLNQLVPPPEVA